MRKSFFFLLILTIILAEDEIDSVKARGKTVSSFFQNSAEFYDSYNSSVFSKAPEQSEPPQLGEFKNYDELPRKVKNNKNPKQKPLMPTSRGEIIARYGDPKTMPAVDPEELKNAPPWIKGAVAAWYAGDKELFNEYIAKNAEHHEHIMAIHRMISAGTNEIMDKRQLVGSDLKSGKEFEKKLATINFVEKVDPKFMEKLDQPAPSFGSDLGKEEAVYSLSRLYDALASKDPERLDQLAQDIVNHYNLKGRAFSVRVLFNPTSSGAVARLSQALKTFDEFPELLTDIKVICVVHCTSQDVLLLGGQKNIKVLFETNEKINLLDQKKDIEMILVDKISGEAVRLHEANSLLLRHLFMAIKAG